MIIHPDVNAKLIAPILSVIKDMLHQILDISSEMGRMYVLNVPFQSKGIGALIDITGDYNGKIFLEMDSKAAVKLAELFLNENIEKFDDTVISGVGELLNIIAAKISGKVSNFANIVMSTPKIITKFSKIIDNNRKNIMIIPVGFGKYIINVSFYLV